METGRLESGRLADGSSPLVAVLGLGRVGSALAAGLLRDGFRVTVWDRTAGRAAHVVPLGALEAHSAAGAARLADVVVLALPGLEAVRQVLLDGPDPVVEAIHRDAVVVDVSTTGPPGARSVAAELDRRGVRFVEAPVTGSPRLAEDGSLATHAGGDPEVVALVLPLLESWSAPGRITFTGEAGTGNAAKVVATVGEAVAAQAVGEALRLGRDLGLSRRTVLDVLRGGPLGQYVTGRERMLLDRDSRTTEHFRLELALTDLATALSYAAAALPATEAAYLKARLAVEQGDGDRDLVELALLREGVQELDESDLALLEDARDAS